MKKIAIAVDSAVIKNELHTGIFLIAQERMEQQTKHGFDFKNDKYYSDGEIEQVVVCLVTDNWLNYPKNWGQWFLDKIEAKRDRLSDKDFTVERLKIAGALLAADIDRINKKNKL